MEIILAVPFFISFPHSGEKVPESAYWLKDLNEIQLMFDVDRYVDKIYQPIVEKLNIKKVYSPWHRYVVDLNRFDDEVSPETVEGSVQKQDSMSRGLHWTSTTQNHPLLTGPITKKLHNELIENYYRPFHNNILKTYEEFFNEKFPRVFQLDAHSMPSKGTSAHRDPGANRAQVVISDFEGLSCDSDYKAIVVEAFKKVGFEVEINWPYVGGRITQMYGQPHKGQNCIQVELNRSIYMNEETKQLENSKYEVTSKMVSEAVEIIYENVEEVS